MFNRRGQSTLEYALIVAIIVAGLLLMQHYVRRGYAGRLRTASDDMGDQYDPTAFQSNYKVSQSSRAASTIDFGTRESQTKHLADQVSTRTGSEDVNAWQETEDLYSK